MNRLSLLTTLTLLGGTACTPTQQRQTPVLPEIELRHGLVITRSARVAPRTYRLPAAPSLDSAVITVRGDGITVDFAGATIEGAPPEANPDVGVGIAVRIDGGRDVRILNARIRGYRIGIIARGTRGLTLAGNDLSYNWKPRLYSLIEHESLVDWLSFHRNDKDEWLRYGAGFYLADVQGGEIHGNTVEQGMNGLMLVRTDSVLIRENNFSFNSGVGIGLYRSNHNRIMHNRADYNVRGYSEGFYRRGQDAADLLMYEQSSHNVVAYNSMTHGGDGVFLWAGQSTMDTGAGGANDNLFYGNDFSFAPANCIEATFSRNTFVANHLEGCEYGVWAGYSYSSRFAGNRFLRNRFGLAIEHGQDNLVTENIFEEDSTAIRLWADPMQPSDWGYPKHRDTRSRDYKIEGNLFTRNRVGVRAARTTGLRVIDNRFVAVDSTIVPADSTQLDSRRNSVSAIAPDALPPVVRSSRGFDRLAPPPLRNAFMPLRAPPSSIARWPRSAIIVDEWGPYDWRSPRLWPADSSHHLPLPLRVLGPVGRWQVISRRGVESVTPLSGRVGDTIVVVPRRDSIDDWSLELGYAGGATVSPRGVLGKAETPYRFAYTVFEPRIEWTQRFYKWSDSTSDLRKAPASPFAFATSRPIVSLQVPRLDFEGYRAFRSDVPREFFAVEATGTVDLAPGEYALRTISDDGVRVWVDGALVIDNWAPHESVLDFATLSGGRHDIRVQYYQADGWYELRLDIVRGRDRSQGSPGASGQ